MSLPRYPEYKDSGVAWLGEVPAHWALSRIKRMALINMGQSPSSEDCNQDGDGVAFLQGNADFGVEHPIPRSFCTTANKFARRGDILFSVRAPVGAINIADQDYGIGRGLCAISPTPETVQGFLCYVMHVARNELFSVATGSTYEAVSVEQIGNASGLLPTLEEQTAIAAFLDRETAKIDALIAEQEKLLTLLAEKRQATISHAVTKGLNQDAPMKDSGVEWLGEVPAHWDVRRVKDVSKLESGHTPSKQFPEYWENCEIPWVSLNDSKYLAANDFITDTAVKINELGLANSSARVLPAESVVFTRDATIGLAAITTRPMAVSQHLIAWCPTGKVLPKYLLRVFNAMKSHLDSYTFGATIKTIGMGDVKTLTTPVPPIQEQVEIVQVLDTKLCQIDLLSCEATRAIDLLKERRTALISAAVTGKIDVRNA